ncbi:tetratricopeptide repeat protein [Nitratidesulfovibrio liaohensis]|uniref:tetratricopeptide repeat protein n=1 Tax=Nitratidesulfovibrio liaohensis TaxID=2604158 RepID=UPI001424833F|nr:tetratricopeptide repeat protein [Nitratidesulfovibrio liaohensis]NHZ46236.1 tetratricopeptide repeat protein [Nitratidesulfovibrio liaohensis]
MGKPSRDAARTTPRKFVLLVMAASVAAIFLTAFLRDPAATRGQNGSQARQTGPDPSQVATLMKKVQENPGDREAIMELSELFSRAKDWPNATIFWGKAIALDTGDTSAYFHRGHALLELQRYDEALADYGTIITLKPDAYVAHYYIGMIQKYEKNAPDVASEHFMKALSLNPKDKGLVAELNKELASLK